MPVSIKLRESVPDLLAFLAFSRATIRSLSVRLQRGCLDGEALARVLKSTRTQASLIKLDLHCRGEREAEAFALNGASEICQTLTGIRHLSIFIEPLKIPHSLFFCLNTAPEAFRAHISELVGSNFTEIFGKSR